MLNGPPSEKALYPSNPEPSSKTHKSKKNHAQFEYAHYRHRTIPFGDLVQYQEEWKEEYKQIADDYCRGNEEMLRCLHNLPWKDAYKRSIQTVKSAELPYKMFLKKLKKFTTQLCDK